MMLAEFVTVMAARAPQTAKPEMIVPPSPPLQAVARAHLGSMITAVFVTVIAALVNSDLPPPASI